MGNSKDKIYNLFILTVSKKRGIQALKYNSVEKLPYEQKTYEIRITHKLLLKD